MKRPYWDESYLAPKLSSPLSLSRSLPVKCIGLASPQVPVIVWPSPNGKLVIVSQGVVAPGSERARSVPSQSEKLNAVVPLVPPLYVAKCRPPAYTSPRVQLPADVTCVISWPPESYRKSTVPPLLVVFRIRRPPASYT